MNEIKKSDIGLVSMKVKKLDIGLVVTTQKGRHKYSHHVAPFLAFTLLHVDAVGVFLTSTDRASLDPGVNGINAEKCQRCDGYSTLSYLFEACRF